MPEQSDDNFEREMAESSRKKLGRKDVYLGTVDRLEPEIAMIDAGAYHASAAISLKRIADALEEVVFILKTGN